MRGEDESIAAAGSDEPGTAPESDDGTLEAVAIALPAAPPGRPGAMLLSVTLAGLLHAGLLALLAMPDRGLGIGGADFDAIGIEIVTVAPALEARDGARGRGAAGGSARVAAIDGDTIDTAEQQGAPDNRRETEVVPTEAAAPPADLAVPDWTEPPQPPDAAATEPVIARAKGDGATPAAPDRLRPSIPEQTPMSVADSIPATELLASRQGGAAARGRETIDVAAAVMAAARAGRRDDYRLAVFKAIYARPPRAVQGLAGETRVKVMFSVLTGGMIGDIQVVEPSGNASVDEAVVAALRTTQVPAPPGELAGAALSYDMVFTFK